MKRRSLTLAATLLLLVSCSTTKVLKEGEYRLYDNFIVMKEGKEAPPSSSLYPYFNQKANNYTIGHWSPGLYIYNWENGRGGAWDRFVHKLGTAPVILDSSSIDSSVKMMASHMDYLGYYDSQIDAGISYKKKLASVTYVIDPGRRFKLDRVDFIIPDPLIDSILTSKSEDIGIRRGQFLSSSFLEAEAEKMASWLRNDGYFGMSKNFFFFYADTTDTGEKYGKANLTVNLKNHTINETETMARPHRRYTFGNVSVTKPEGTVVRDKLLDGLNKIHTGDIYSEETVNSTYSRLSSIPLFNTVNIGLKASESDSSAIDCSITLSKSKLQGLKLDLSGSFNSTGLFGITPAITYSHKNIFHAGEVLTLGFTGNFQFKIRDKNTKANEFGVSASLQLPRFLLLSNSLFKLSVPRTAVSLAFNYQNRPEYTRNIVSTSYGYIWSTRNKFFFNVYPVKLNAVKIYDMDDDFYSKLNDPYLINAYQDHLDFGSEGTFYYTTDASMNPKSTYFYTRVTANASGNVLSIFNGLMPTDEKSGAHKFCGVPYSQYLRIEASAVQTLRFGSENQLALAGRLLAGYGYAYGNSVSIPFEKFFYSGGTYSLRGWRARSVGPGSAPLDQSFSIANQSGDMRLEANLEFRFPIIWKFSGGVFADAGNIWNIDRGDGSRDPLSLFHFKDFIRTSALDWGVGLRLDFGLILIRVDWGMQLYDPARQSWCRPAEWFDGHSAVNFGIGYPF